MRKNLRKIRLIGLALPAMLIIGSAPMSADTLHGFCTGATSCTAGTVIITTTNPPSFGFWDASGPNTGDFRVDFLVPNNEAPTPPSSLTIPITGVQGGPTNTSPISATATLVSSTAWTSGALDAYLGISASPTNPIGAYLPCTQNPSSCGATGGTPDAGATGFYVYQADLGTTRLQPQSTELLGPLMTSGSLPLDSFILAFLNEGTAAAPSWTATANSESIFESRGPTPTIPEPASLLLLGSGLLGIPLLRKLAKRN